MAKNPIAKNLNKFNRAHTTPSLAELKARRDKKIKQIIRYIAMRDNCG